MEMGLADVLKTWRMECGYSQPSDYIFASADMDGKQPLWPNSAMEDQHRPAAIRAEITKRLGWHTLRHTFGTLLKANGEDVAVVQSLMRHANVSVTMDKYVQAVTPAKRRAQRGIVGLLDPNGPTRRARPLASDSKDGGRYRIRTYDFHRVKHGTLPLSWRPVKQVEPTFVLYQLHSRKPAKEISQQLSATSL